MNHGNNNHIASAHPIQESDLLHCLTRQYQDCVAKIHQTNDLNRGNNKRTGIWDETHRCDD